MLKLCRRNGSQDMFSTYTLRWVFGYTTSATTNAISSNNVTVHYLVNSLGFSKQEASVASSKVSPFKSTENPDSVVNFLLSSGFSNTQIKKIVSTFPRILSCNIDKTLKPKLEAFQDLGLSGSSLANIISTCPAILLRSFNDHVMPTLEVLTSVLGDDLGDVLALLSTSKSKSSLLASGAQKSLPENVALLQSYGFSAEKIKLMILRKPKYFVMNPKWLQAVLIKVEEKLGIPRDSAMFSHAVCVLCSISEESIHLKLEIYKSFGFTESDISTMIKRNPYTLMLSESKIRRCLSHYIQELGYNPGEIASHSYVLNQSLEKRVVPRSLVIKALKENLLINTSYCIFSCLNFNEATFFGKFVLPFKNKVPGLYDDYMRRVHPHLEVVGK